MNANDHIKPAWQTDDLAEEWIEEEQDDIGTDQQLRTSRKQASIKDLQEFTSTSTRRKRFSTDEDTKSAGPGTFVIREDVQALPILPQTPGKRPVIKDFFSPLALEKLFEPPSPPQQSLGQVSISPSPAPAVQQRRMGPAKPSKLSQVVSQSFFEKEAVEDLDEIVETDMQNMIAFGGHKLSTNCQFTFSVPQKNDPGHGNHLYPDSQPQAQSTPLPQFDSEKQLSAESIPPAQSTPLPPMNSDKNMRPPTDPCLRLFQFQYDTYTREHLSAIVDSIGVNSPSSEGSTGGPIELRQVANIEQEQDISYAHLRSTKRIKLSPTDGHSTKDRIEGRRLLRPKNTRDYVGESKSLMQQIKKQARDISLLSIVDQTAGLPTQVEIQEVESELTHNAPQAHAQKMLLDIPELNVPRPASAASTFASGGSKSNSYSSASYRQQASVLMAQIKSDMRGSRRLFSDQTENSSVEEHRHHRKASSKTKLNNDVTHQQGDPDSVLEEPQKGEEKGVTLVDDVGTGEHDTVNDKENKQPPSNYQTRSPLEQEQYLLPSMKPKLFSSIQRNNNGPAVLTDDARPATVLGKSCGGATNADSVEKPKASIATAATVLTEVSNTNIGVSPPSISRVFHRSSPNPTFSAPSTGRGASIRARSNAGGSDVNNNQQNHPHVTNANEDLNRFVSSSTTATTATGTTLTAGSFVKHPGPAHMVHIAPNDVPRLPERVGKMIFDRDLMRWMKVRDVDIWAAHDVAVDYNLQKGGVVGREGEEESEDPFRDIESLRGEEDSTKQEMNMLEAADNNNDQDELSEDMSVENDTDDESDDEEKELITFSFDGPPSGIVEVMTGDCSMDTDSVDEDNEDLEAGEFYEEVDSIIDAPDDGLSTMTSSMSLSPQKNFQYLSPARPSIPASSSAPIVVLSTPRTTYNNIVPSSSSRVLPPPRSVLKNTPNPMSFTRHQVYQNGNTPVRSGSNSNGNSNSGHRRSVSFSDGRKDGKIIGLDIRRNGGSASMITPSNSGGTVSSENNNFNGTPTPLGMSTHPSVRTNRITEMLEEIEEPLGGSVDEDEDEDRDDVDTTRTRALPPSQILMSPNKRRALSASATATATATAPALVNSLNRGGRSPLTRSRTYRGATASTSSQQQQQVHTSNITNNNTLNTLNTTTTTNNNQTFLTECSFGVTHDKLVRLLTDVCPFEPYWNTLRVVDLAGRRVDSVARLKEFMPRLDEVNLNDNLLTYLSGIPSTVRSLSAASNALTSLTSYAHLRRLECLDISKNEVDSLRPLGVLKHLRELRADDNRIGSLGGVEGLDGLVKLSLRGNEVGGDVDFGGVVWPRLEMLDLSYNRIERVGGLGVLSSLVAVNLDNNLLTSIALSTLSSSCETHVQVQRTLPTLRILRLSCNRLTCVDMGMFPGVKTVYVDENRLAGREKGLGLGLGLVNLSKMRKLENLSARSQSGGGVLELYGKDIRDIKRLYLSGNPTPLPLLKNECIACFHLTYLELAGCRLSELPEGLSGSMPNVRALNVNYNFLGSEEIGRGIEGMGRLKKLSAVGCRMVGLKRVVRALRGCREIEMVDFRMNPCTLEWYVPLLVPLNSTGSRKEEEWERMDKGYRRSLPDEIYAGRMAYRGIVMEACSGLVWMDGVRVGEREREKAGRVIRRVMGK